MGEKGEQIRILLVGNYAADQQESMLRFTQMMGEGLGNLRIEYEVLAPRVWIGRLRPARTALGKWLGYVDKYVLFPVQLRWKISTLRSGGVRDKRLLEKGRATSQRSTPVVVHICDHSNAPYAAHVGSASCVVTCHDLGAVRGALGEATYCPASATGKVLQRWILRSLARVTRIVCDSTATRSDVHRLLGAACPKTQVVLLGLNQTFAQRPDDETTEVLANAAPHLDLLRPFLLHVGSSLTRKNRDGVMRIFESLLHRWDGQLVFAGESLTPELSELARRLGVEDRMRVILQPSSVVLEALYNRAFALLFPSRFEGFGWPVVEAQACGCPVLCSDAASLPEVAGAGALIRAVEDEAGFAEDVLRLTDPDLRDSLVGRGFENLSRFETRRMVENYLRIYRAAAGLT